MLYVYGIVDGPTFEPLPGEGFEGENVVAISSGPVAAAVSFYSGCTSAATAAAVWHHERVLERLMRTHTVLPLRFGTVCTSVGALTAVLEGAATGLLRDLDHVRGKVEIALHIATTPDGEPLETVEGGRGAVYLRTRIREHHRERARESEAAHMGELLRLRLGSDLTDVRCVPAPASGYRASCLVKHDRIAAFRGALDRFQVENPQFEMTQTGPWPAYSFVSATPLVGETQ